MSLISRLNRAIGLNPLAIRIAALHYTPTDLDGDRTDYQRFVIAGYQRSGSTMLVSALKEHSQAYCYGEAYNAARPMLWTPGYSNDSPWLKAIRDHRPAAFLERFIFRGYLSRIRAVGFKIFPEHAQDPRFQQLFVDLLADSGVKFIHLTRGNKLAVYLSMQRARASGIWALNKDGRQESQPIHLDPQACAAGLAALDEQEQFFRQALAGQEHLQVSYEQLTGDQENQFLAIQTYLGLTPETMQPQTKKQAKGSLKDGIANYDELRDYFAGTPAGTYFND
jgi:LPS sulfotransferase NodH